MARTICRAWLLSILLALTATGCKGLFASQGLPHDPMFLDKQPIAAKAQSAPPIAQPFAEPTPPAHPALADGPLIAAPPRPVPGTLTNWPAPPPAQRDDR